MPELCTHPQGELLTLANSGSAVPVPWRVLTVAGQRTEGQVFRATLALCRACGQDVVRVSTWRPGTRPVWGSRWVLLTLTPTEVTTDA